MPFHAVSAANWIGVYAQRYMHDYGLTREQLAQIPLNQRRHVTNRTTALGRVAGGVDLDQHPGSRRPLCNLVDQRR